MPGFTLFGQGGPRIIQPPARPPRGPFAERPPFVDAGSARANPYTAQESFLRGITNYYRTYPRPQPTEETDAESLRRARRMVSDFFRGDPRALGPVSGADQLVREAVLRERIRAAQEGQLPYFTPGNLLATPERLLDLIDRRLALLAEEKEVSIFRGFIFAPLVRFGLLGGEFATGLIKSPAAQNEEEAILRELQARVEEARRRFQFSIAAVFPLLSLLGGLNQPMELADP